MKSFGFGCQYTIQNGVLVPLVCHLDLIFHFSKELTNDAQKNYAKENKIEEEAKRSAKKFQH